MTEASSDRTVNANRLPDAGAGSVWDTSGPGPVLRPEADDVVAAFTTRIGGTSEPPFDTLNLSYSVGDDPGRVARNRDIAAGMIGSDGRWSPLRQVHGAEVVRSGGPEPHPEADGVWTDTDDALKINVADCVPVLLTGPRRLGAAHAGWRGLVAGIVERTAEAVGATAVWAGPAIGPCCYEVGAEVVDAFAERFGPGSVAGPRHVDLWAAAEVAARAAGVEQVFTARVCTACHPELFFSHRRDRGRTGRQALIARLDA